MQNGFKSKIKNQKSKYPQDLKREERGMMMKKERKNIRSLFTIKESDDEKKDQVSDLLDQIKAMGGGDKKDGLRPLSMELETRETAEIQPKRMSASDWKNRMKVLRHIRARCDDEKKDVEEKEDDDWITPKEARSEVKKQYLGNRSLTLAQKFRLEDLIERGKPELAVATVMEAKKNTSQVKLKRKDSDGT